MSNKQQDDRRIWRADDGTIFIRAGTYTMNDDWRREIAKLYVDRQLAAMEESGLKTRKVSDEEYQSMVDQVAAEVKT